jgi:hypothetical protein
VSTQTSHAESKHADSESVGRAETPRVRSGKKSNRRRAVVWTVTAVVLAGAGAGVWLARPFSGRGGSTGVSDNAYPVAYQTVTRQTLTSQTPVDGSLGYAGGYSAVNEAHGIYSWLPSAGQVIRDGQVLYRVDGDPVILLYGSVPAYRSLAEGQYGSSVTGPDVQQLNRDLVDMGYVSSADLDPSSDEFTWATKYGLERLQAALGVKQTGALGLGQAVFLPSAAVRVTAVQPTLGTQAGPGAPVATASSTARQVSVNLDAAQQSQVAVGDQVTITLPNGRTTPGRVASVSKVATNSSSGATVTVLITPLDQAATGTLDQAPVTVSITTGSVSGALVVPASALLALTGGGYAIEEVNASGVHHLVPVSLGLFDDADGLVQVSGPGLAAGQRVVVPAT